MARLADRLAALATMSQTMLREEWTNLKGGSAPALPPDLMRRLLAYELQEKRHGGLSLSVARHLARVATGEAPAPPKVRKILSPGTRLVRSWQGRTISVLVVETGFVWEDRSYRSLSRIAKEVTGAHWSGPRFFGLTGHG